MKSLGLNGVEVPRCKLDRKANHNKLRAMEKKIKIKNKNKKSRRVGDFLFATEDDYIIKPQN